MHAPGRHADVRRDAGRAPPAARPRPGGDRAARRRRDQRRLRQQPRADVAGQRRRRPTSAPPSSSTRSGTACSSSRCCSAATRPTSRRCSRTSSRTATWPTIRQPLDFYGVNYYNPFRIGAAAEDAEMPFEFRELLGYPMTDFGWPVVPDALREWLITAPRPLPRRPAADLHHRVRLRLQHGAGRATASSTTSRASTTSTPTCARSPRAVPARRRRPRLLRVVAAWTTSSGPRATPSASASCTSTTRRRSARRSGRSSGTPT